jgi:lipoteichoic acid synthase
MRHYRQSTFLRAAAFLPVISRIICTGMIAWVLAVVFRVFIIDPKPTAAKLPVVILSGFGASYYDLLFILALVIVCLALIILLPVSKRLVTSIEVVFCLLIAVSVTWGFANINLTRLLGEPFTYQWLLYADFLQNADAKSAMRDAVNLRDVGYVLGSVLATIGLGHRLGVLVSRRLRNDRPYAPMSYLVLSAVVLVFLTEHAIIGVHLPAKKTANPVVHFVASVFDDSVPLLFTMNSSVGSDEFMGVATPSTFPRLMPNPIKNVLIFVMESTPAEYLQPYGGKYPVTPNIEKYSEYAKKFDNIYAHAPATAFSLFSLFTSVYPDISYRSMTLAHPDLPLISISNVFADNGFRTSFFWSADSRFQAFDQFLENKKLDVVKDFQSIECDQPIFKLSTKAYENMDYAHDVCTATELMDWVEANSDRPFFAMMMTAMTHYPYETHATLEHYVDDEKQNAFLNALRIGDEAFGVIMDRLEATGKLDSTLVVLLGDHGEAFGQHGNFAHASALYEENVHIPLLLFNPQLFGGDSEPTIGGTVDVAPTVLDIAGIPAPESWEGRSLFGTKRANRAYFFTPWNSYLFGYREGDMKTLFNGATGAVERYDLAKDPHERNNLVEEGADIRPMLDPIAAWVQYQRAFIADKIASSSAAM